MPGLRIDNFSGIVPRTGPTALEGNQAQIANNAKLTSLEIRPWRTPTLEYTPNGGASVQSIFKFSGPSGSSPVWLEWNYDVDVVPGPVADLSEFRLYFTSSGFTPRKTNWALATSSATAPYPNNYYEMGVPVPAGAPSVTKAGTGTAPTEDRSYIYTYITTFGYVAEESDPSPATII
jgi:hypothetical protein